MTMFSDRFVNLLDFDGTAATDLALAVQRVSAALAGRGVAGARVYYISRDCTLSGFLELPTEVSVEFAPGARVELVGGAVLVIRGRVSLGMGQHFVLSELSQVELLGEIEGVRPDWFWDRTSAADDALDAAFGLVRRRAAEGVSAVPLLLSSSYRLTRPWQLRTRPGSPLVVDIVGRHPVGDAVIPSTLAVDTNSLVTSIVDVGAGVSVRMDRVALSSVGAPHAHGAALMNLEGDNDDTLFHRCSFFCGGGAAVRARSIETSDEARIGFSECWVDGGEGHDTDVELVSFGSGGRRARVSVEGCRFVGNARALIYIRGGVAEIIDCTFVNQSAEGCDVCVESSVDTVGKRVEVLPVDLIVTHVRSGTRTHLRGYGSGGSVSITGLTHVPPSGGGVAVSWRGLVESGLLLQGCNLGGAVEVDTGVRVVLLATRFRGGVSAPAGAATASPPTWLR